MAQPPEAGRPPGVTSQTIVERNDSMSNDNSKPFYVYVHRRKDNNAIFYVGKGRGRRLNQYWQRNPYWTKVSTKHGFLAEVISTHESELDAFAHERFLIASLRLYCDLANITDGGEGNSGLKHSDEARARMSAKRRGKPLAAQHRENVAAAMKRPEVNRKRSESIRAFYANEENAAAFRESARERNQRHEVRGNVGAGVSRSRRESGYVTPVINATTGRQFDCLKDATDWLHSIGKTKASHAGILRVCSKPGRSAYGYRWEYPTNSHG
jgi:hypothetical protein